MVVIVIVVVIVIITYALNTIKRHLICMGIALNQIFDSRTAQPSYYKGKLVCGLTIG